MVSVLVNPQLGGVVSVLVIPQEGAVVSFPVSTQEGGVVSVLLSPQEGGTDSDLVSTHKKDVPCVLVIPSECKGSLDFLPVSSGEVHIAIVSVSSSGRDMASVLVSFSVACLAACLSVLRKVV